MTTRAPHELAPGTVLGGYRLDALLGRGGFAAVFRATSLASGEATAVKVLSRVALDRAGGIVRFHREVELVSRLRHPNTVRLLGAGEDARGWLFIAFELLVGRSVDEALEEDGPMQPAHAAAIAREALAALEEAHSIGLVHRDIKPANLFLASAPERVKLLDFGVAKSTRPETLEGLTRPGSTLGTPLYMAPEQIMAQLVTARADVFSLGIVLAEMVHGRDIFEGILPMQLMTDRISGKRVPIPKELDRSPLRTIVERATQLDPGARFSGAAEMRAALEAVMPSLRSSSIVPPFAMESTALALPPSSFAEESTAFASVSTPSKATRAPTTVKAPIASRRSRWRLAALGAVLVVAPVAGALAIPRLARHVQSSHSAPRRTAAPKPSVSATDPSAPATPSVAIPAVPVDYLADPRPLLKMLGEGLPAGARVHNLVVYPKSATLTIEDAGRKGKVMAYAADTTRVRKLFPSTDNATGAFVLDDAHLAVIPRVVADAKTRVARRVLYVTIFCESCTPTDHVSVAMGGEDGAIPILVFYTLDGRFRSVK